MGAEGVDDTGKTTFVGCAARPIECAKRVQAASVRADCCQALVLRT
jgi:hypothetical protein